MTPEGKLKKEIREYLTSLGPECWFYSPVPNGYGRTGIPDFIGCFKGLFFAIEAKAPTGKISMTQELEMLGIYSAHGLVTLAYTLQQVKNLFEKGEGCITNHGGQLFPIQYQT